MSLDSLNSDAQAQGYLVRLSSQLDRLQASVDEALAASRANERLADALLRHLTDPDAAAALDDRLTAVLQAQEAGREQGEALARGLDELAQNVAKLGRTQFKTNTLAELKDERVASALATLQDVAGQRAQAAQEAAASEVAAAEALRDEGRGQLAAELLPALDGVELALASGRELLARHAEAARQAHGGERPGFWQRLAGRGEPIPASAADPALAEALAGWLDGLEMVRARFLALLATAGIAPIEAAGQAFDPRLHLAMATEARRDAADGAVLRVLRKGYSQRGRVLRYAEVVVNRTGEGGAA